MKRTLALSVVGLLLGCPGILGDDGLCSDEYTRRGWAMQAVESASRKLDGACRQHRAVGCDSLPEFKALEVAMRDQAEAVKAADRCTMEWAKGAAGKQ